MTIAYGFSSPTDILAKAERDLAALQKAQDDSQVGDALYNFAVAITSVRDWLKEQPSKSYSRKHVDDFALGEESLEAFRDIANSNKHRLIKKYTPQTSHVTTSATEQLCMSNFLPYRTKVVMVNRSRHDVVVLGKEAIDKWKAFFVAHGVK